jgi:2-polyprenyl-6-hydroxyphenyl methylase/3-demethylubiquinone-9 3-methyltransferase
MKINRDEQEIHKFDQLGHHWWDLEGPLKPLHQINPLRLQFILQHTTLPQKKVLDVGCGGGILSESLAKNGAQVTGIDLSAKAIAAAQQHAQNQNLIVHYQVSSVEALAEQMPEQFDVITCMELLEHVPDPLSVVQACAQLLKPGGKLFFSTINRNLKAYLGAIIGAEYILGLLPRGTHDYKKFIRPAELASWARAAHLQLLDSQGLGYHLLNSKYYLTPRTGINYFMCLQK